jgi:hypothetical protein
MKSTRYPPAMKYLLLGVLILLTLGVLAACGIPGSTTASARHSLNLPPQASRPLSFTQQGQRQSSQATYPDPTNQSALPASVKVTGTGETVRLSASVSKGYQIYECQVSKTASSGFAWILEAPFAFLKADNGTNVIHSTGPTWLYTLDGSIIQGAVGKFTSANGSVIPASATPNANSIPWLRLDVTAHQGTAGLFSNVNEVQRIYTVGGIAPSSGCDQASAKQHVIKPVPYTAEYVFWG